MFLETAGRVDCRISAWTASTDPVPSSTLYSRLTRAEQAVCLADPTMELRARTLDPVRAPARALAAQLADLRRHVQHQREVRLESARRECVHRAHLVERKPAPVSLIGQRRQRVPVGHDDLAPLQRRTHDLLDENGPRGEHQQQLRPRGHRLAIQKDAPRSPRRSLCRRVHV